jgi:hypothetical protein
MGFHNFRVLGWVALAAWLPATGVAGDVYTPDTLKPWVPWVLQGEEYRRCPFLNGRGPGGPDAHVCAWPGALEIEASANGARFSQPWNLQAEAWVELPGDATAWPLDVELDGKPAAIVDRNGVPATRLGAGTHRLSGRFTWERRPAQLGVPPAVGLVRLTVDGKPVQRPGLDGRTVWLGDRPGSAPAPDSLELRVYRRVEDGIPLLLESRLLLQVGGQGREQSLAQVVPAGFAAMALESVLPARIEADGSLRVQVRPGTWQIVVRARATQISDALAPQLAASEEIWSYQSADRLRVTALEGAAAVDPSQAGVPEDWRMLPGFRVAAGNTLRIVVRGGAVRAADANQLRLHRELWLDFNDGGFTSRDAITGQMRRDWRLDMQPPFRMQSARLNDDYLLVTESGVAGGSGVEVREPELQLEVIGRLPGLSHRAPATGYGQRFESVDATLHLPTGHRLLWARGADQAPEAWVNRWTLLDMFLLLLVAVGAWRLISPAAGAVAFGALLLSYHEPGAPVWPWVNLLAALALASVAPEGRLRLVAQWYRNLSALALLLLLVPFIASQARLILHPQLDAPGTTSPIAYGLAQGRAQLAVPPREAAMAVEEDKVTSDAVVRTDMPRRNVASPRLQGGAFRAPSALSETVVTAARKSGVPPRFAPDALLQTGPGVPAWQLHTYRLVWSGPVEPAEQLDLWILSPWALAILRLIAIGLAATLLGILIRYGYGSPGTWRWRGVGAPPPGVTMLAILVTILSMAAPRAQAADATPDPALLQELKRRLSLPPECAPNCAAIEHAAIDVTAERFTARLTVTALAKTAVPLPALQDRWEPAGVSFGGGQTTEVYRDAARQLWAAVPVGVTTLVLAGGLEGLDSVSIPFPLPPRSVSVATSGWTIGGVMDGRLTSGAVELSRLRRATVEAKSGLAANSFAPFAEVERSISFDLDWAVSTTVRRLAPAREAFALAVDLLPGEAVTAGAEVREGKARVALTTGQDELGFASVLPRNGQLVLAAPKDRPWREVWRVRTSPAWHAAYQGVAPVVPESPEASATPEFRPRPGETVTLSLTRPKATPGATVAIDSVVFAANVGKRSSDISLSFPYRASRGGLQSLRLPANAQLQTLTIDGGSVPSRPRDGVLELSIEPGRHEVAMSWRQDEPVSLWYRSPTVDLATHSANLRTQISLPQDRWILFAAGTGVGPAILYWSELIVFIVVALLFGRTGWTPLKPYEWLLLGFGFSTFSWALLLLVTLWIVALRRRADADLSRLSDRQFNVLQAVLGLLSVIAIAALVSGIPQALLGSPDMQIVGEGSSGSTLQWFSDQTDRALPSSSVLSVHIWWYKGAMLAWALWIVLAFLRWLPWAWQCLTRGGLWRGRIPLVGS